MNIDLVKDWLEARAQRKDLEQQAKAFKEEEDRLGEEIANDMLVDGVDSVKVGGQSVYLAKQLTATCGGDTQSVVDVLREHGMTDLMSVNHNRLKALAKETTLERFPEQFPELAAVVKLEEREVLRSRKA